MIGFQFGAIAPADVPQDQIDHHLRVGLIAPINAPETASRGGKPTAGG